MFHRTTRGISSQTAMMNGLEQRGFIAVGDLVDFLGLHEALEIDVGEVDVELLGGRSWGRAMDVVHRRPGDGESEYVPRRVVSLANHHWPLKNL